MPVERRREVVSGGRRSRYRLRQREWLRLLAEFAVALAIAVLLVVIGR
jgi:hypothetical protein